MTRWDEDRRAELELAELLGHPDPVRRQAASERLLERVEEGEGVTFAITALEAAVTDADPVVSLNAARALLKGGTGNLSEVITEIEIDMSIRMATNTVVVRDMKIAMT